MPDARQTVCPVVAAETSDANDDGVELKLQVDDDVAVTTTVGSDVADAEPASLVAVATPRIVRPTSPLSSG